MNEDYTWCRDSSDDSCSKIECGTLNGAEKICDHLKSDGIPCRVDGLNVVFEQRTLFLKVIRACEPFIGTRLISVHR